MNQKETEPETLEVSEARTAKFCHAVSALAEEHGLTCREVAVGCVSVGAVAAARESIHPHAFLQIAANSYVLAKAKQSAEPEGATSDSSTSNEANGN